MKKIKKSSKKVKKIVVILVVFLCLSLISGGFLIFYLIDSKSYFEIESRIKNVEENRKKDTSNYKTVGWLRVQGTNIDYPILYAPNYEFSMDMNDFVWTEADFKDLSNYVAISGHNILNLSTNPLVTAKDHKRFEQLMSFTYLDFVKDNKYIQYTFGGKEYLYKIFAVSYPKKSEMTLYNQESLSKDKLEELINFSKKNSIFKFDVDVDENDKILSLITCTRMLGKYNSFKVDARLVREKEKIKNYDVSVTKNMEKIDKIMKGGSSDETI